MEPPGTTTVTALAEAFVGRSAQAIWDLLEDGAQVIRVARGVRRIEPVEGTGPGVGQQHVVVHEVDGRQLMVVDEVLEQHPPGYTRSSVTGGPLPAVQERWIEHTGAGCRVRWRVSYEVRVGLTPQQHAALTDEAQAQLQAQAERWKRLAETGSPD